MNQKTQYVCLTFFIAPPTQVDEAVSGLLSRINRLNGMEGVKVLSTAKRPFPFDDPIMFEDLAKEYASQNKHSVASDYMLWVNATTVEWADSRLVGVGGELLHVEDVQTQQPSFASAVVYIEMQSD